MNNNVARNQRIDRRDDGRVALQCNECGKTRRVSPDATFFDRCPKCGGVDWDVQ